MVMASAYLCRDSKRSASSTCASPRSARRYSAMRRYRIETSALCASVSEAAMPNSASAAPSAGERIAPSGPLQETAIGFQHARRGRGGGQRLLVGGIGGGSIAQIVLDQRAVKGG